MIEPFLPFLRETLERYPELSAAALYGMVQRRGYPGGSDHFRYLVRTLGLRPRKTPEAFLELRTLPGEQAQVDWGYFGERKVLGGVRKLWAFVVVLSYSRSMFFRFYYDSRMLSFLDGHVRAAEAFSGCARVWLYDNLKSAVLERRGDVVRFHPRLLELADHYGFEPRPVAPRRGNEKGRVERAIRYLRTSFFPLRQTLSLDALNEAADEWIREIAAKRRWPQDRGLSVEQAYHRERPYLRPLPGEPFPAREHLTAQVRKTPYVRLDTNKYSVPHDRVGRSVAVLADIERVRILDADEQIAEHTRSWDKQRVIENPAHIEALQRAKRHARRHRNQDRLTRAVPGSETLLAAMARRQAHLASAVEHLLLLLDTYGPEETEQAVREAVDKGLAPSRDRPIDPRSSVPQPAHGSTDPPAAARAARSQRPGRRAPLLGRLRPQRRSERGRRLVNTDDDLKKRARRLKLHGLLDHWTEVAEQPWVEKLVDWEEKSRGRRSLERRLRQAKLGTFKPIEDFDWGLAEQNRSATDRRDPESGLDRASRQPRARGAQRGRQDPTGQKHRPQGRAQGLRRSMYHRLRAAQHPRRARLHVLSAPQARPLHPSFTPTHRRARVSVLRPAGTPTCSSR